MTKLQSMDLLTKTLSKTCTRCKKVKNLNDYHSSGYVKVDGTKSKSSWCKECSNESRAARAFGIDYKEYYKMLEKQKNCCCNKGCQAKVPGAGRTKFYIDHCHSTGKIRGLLCHNCNLALGHVKDNKEKLKGLIEYLDIHG